MSTLEIGQEVGQEAISAAIKGKGTTLVICYTLININNDSKFSYQFVARNVGMLVHVGRNISIYNYQFVVKNIGILLHVGRQEY